MDLFINTDMQFEKVAAEVELPEDPNQWPQEILDELYKQVPFVADFQPHVVMDKVDAERAYGFGNVEIANKSEAQVGTEPSMMQAAGIRTVRIPVLIREGKLYSFDILINDAGKALPLTESRLRQALFRPQAFDVTSQTPGDQSMIGQLYPPYRQNYGFGGGGLTVPADGMGKQSSVLEEFLIQDLESLDPGGFRRPKEKTAVSKEWLAEKVEKASPGASAERLKEFVERVKGKGTPPMGSKRQVAAGAAASRLIKETLMGKHGSVLEAILPTINTSDLDRFWSTFDHAPGVQAAFVKNANACGWAVQLLAGAAPVKTASVADFVQPDVAQIIKVDDGYIIKSASSKCWDVQIEKIARGDLLRRFGEKIALAADTAGAVTLADGAAAAPEEKPSNEVNVQHSGLYKVRDEKGRDLIGYVIPNLIDMDGMPVPLSLFTNGSQTTVQSDIVGEPVSSGANLPTGEPGGTGAFFTIADDGTIRATLPMTLHGGTSMPGEPMVFMGETYDGRPAQVSVQPNIQEPVGMEEEGRLLIPESWKWTPMDKADHVVLEGGEDAEGPPEEVGGATPPAAPPEAAEAMPPKAASVFIRSDMSTFSFAGEPVEKLASDEREFLDVDQAMFLLAGLGVDQDYSLAKLAESMAGSPARVRVGRFIKTAAERKHEAFELAKVAMQSIPQLRQDTIKEAAHLPDPTAIDTVLSLNFINPENLMTFVGYLPVIDNAQSKMCELLISARMGMSEVPISALERAVRATEEVIEGLKVIAFQD